MTQSHPDKPRAPQREGQHTIGAWIDATFPGTDPGSPRKSLRALEEMVELCLASGASAYDIQLTVARVFAKEILVPGTAAYINRRLQPEKVPAEAADVVIVVNGIAHMRKFDLQAEIDRKMAINRARRWKPNGDGTGYHIKEPADVQQPGAPTP